MGGKRSDQYRIDRDEGRTTDHKFLPEEPREASAQDHRFSRVMQSELDAVQPLAPQVLEPDAERARERQTARRKKRRKR